ncbi:RraA family protein [Afifella sp. IM 167]|uniref:RraA family protein n=1 Tax=Afifella sp. IM 167 TaxID=2033586 RepID=UPI001CCC9461
MRILERLRGVESGAVTDALVRLGLSGWMDGVLPLGEANRLVGRARTVKYTPKTGATKAKENIYSVIRSTPEGRVLVLDTGCADTWILGENVAHAASFQGLNGLISDSLARDAALIREMDFPVFTRGISARPPAIVLVDVDVPVECAGARVCPGDYIVADADGVVVIPQEFIDVVLVEVEDIEQLERDQAAALAAQAPLEVINDLLRRKKIRKSGRP